MNPFLLSPSELLQNWKDLRNNLNSFSEFEQLQQVVDFWSKAPLKKVSYDPETLDTYPSPWEMINENDWCENSLSVGMEFTLRLGGWDSNRLKIKMIRDYDESIQRLILVVDDKYFLNYQYNDIIENLNTNHDILTVWNFNGRKYIKND